MVRRLLMVPVLLGGLISPSPGPQQPPRFPDFPVTEPVYRGPHAAPRIKPSTAAWHFRTRIREAARMAPNFAGHYVLATWGCGAECRSYAVIDVKTGTVWFEEHTVCCWYEVGGATCCGVTGPDDAFEPVDFRLDSRLVVLTGLLNEAGNKARHYFQFANGRPVPIR
jgi:hypothetical protein